MQCVTLWIGDRLGPVERACFRSLLAQGHSLALYCYSRPRGVPDGVELRDAEAVIPRSQVFVHRRNSFAPFSDWFRYELQDRGAGIWLDADVYLIAPIDTDEPYLFGEESAGVLNNAVLRLPAQSDLLAGLLSPFRTRVAPPWMRRNSGRRELLGPKPDKKDPATWPWATMGPLGLTAMAKSQGLLSKAQGAAVFYPIAWTRADWIRDPRTDLNDVITPETRAVHLWNQTIATFKDKPAPVGSFLARLQQEGAE